MEEIMFSNYFLANRHRDVQLHGSLFSRWGCQIWRECGARRVCITQIGTHSGFHPLVLTMLTKPDCFHWPCCLVCSQSSNFVRVRCRYNKLWRLLFTIREAVSDELELLLRESIIECTDVSPWTSPILVTTRKDSSPRLCWFKWT